MNWTNNSGYGFPLTGHLIGYENLTDHGSALPCFGQIRGNLIYVAQTLHAGDPGALIDYFEPYQPEHLQPLPVDQDSVVQIGDPWIDVFLWNGRPYHGTTTAVWEALAPVRDEIMAHAPLSLLKLAEGVPGAQRDHIARGTFDWLKRRYGVAKASTWRMDTYFCGVATRNIRRQLGDRAHLGRIRHAVQYLELRQNGTEITLLLPAILAEEVVLDTAKFTDLQQVVNAFDLRLSTIETARQSYRVPTLQPRSYQRPDTVNELRSLVAIYPSDASLLARFARALCGALNLARARRNRSQSDAFLNDLRALFAAHPHDATVRDSLTRALVSTLVTENSDGRSERRDALLQELRDLVTGHIDDVSIRESLATALIELLDKAISLGDTSWSEALLDEIRRLAELDLSVTSICRILSMALVNTLLAMNSRDQSAQRKALLEELRSLADSNPSDVSLQERLAMGLVNRLTEFPQEDEQQLHDELMAALRVIVTAQAPTSSSR